MTVANIRCKYWDCGWCYADEGENTNSISGACKGSIECNLHRKNCEKLLRYAPDGTSPEVKPINNTLGLTK